MLLAISGLAGTGKDTVADILQKGSLVKVALADPLKRIARDVYDFSDDQLWGPSFKRNEPDERYPREHTWKPSVSWAAIDDGPIKDVKCVCCGQSTTLRLVEDDVRIPDLDGVNPCFLTARYALQTLGTEWGRDCFPDTWVKYAIRVHDRLQNGDCAYDQKFGLRWHAKFEGETWVRPKKDVIISDTRFMNELFIIRAHGGKAIRITRPGVEVPAWAHPSETEQMGIPDSEFDYIIRNDGTLDDLLVKTREMIEKLAV